MLVKRRLPVSKEDLEKAKNEGVVQKRPDGNWGIIAIEKKVQKKLWRLITPINLIIINNFKL